MKFDLAHFVQRGHHFAIVDEVDSHPDRRGADAAHHLGPGGRVDGPLLRGRSHHPAPEAGRRHARRDQGRGPGSSRSHGRLHPRREAQDGHAHRERDGEGRGAAGAPAATGRALRPRQHAAAPPREPGAARAHDLQARRRLHDQGRSGRHRRRVHGPPDARAPVERRAAPGRRGQGEGEDRAREPDARHHHLPELLPQVRQAVGHDRHGRHRGRRVRQDLQAGRQRHPDQPRAACASKSRTRSTAPSARSTTRSSPTSSRSRTRGGRRWWARSRSRSPSGSRRC